VQYYQFLRLGFDGYKRIMRHTVDNASLLRRKLVESGYFTIMNETQRIPVVALTLDKKVKNFNEFDVSNKVREKGWVLSAYTMPPNAQEVTSLRIVVRPHINLNMAETLAEDIVKACDWLSKNGGNAKPPVLHKTVEKESPIIC
jgi:glutamate decarboxylase